MWGFKTAKQKEIFELLKTVNKVGSSKAYPLVTQFDISELLTAISVEDTSLLVKAPGIGKKMAEQIISKAKDKVNKMDMLSSLVDLNIKKVSKTKQIYLSMVKLLWH